MTNSFTIFNLTIYFYSLFILSGMTLAYILITREAKRFNIDDDLISNMIFGGILSGIVGARLYYVIFNLDYYLTDISEIIKVWHGGLAIHGGILGGLLFIYYYTKKHKLNLLLIIDFIAPALIIAQAIGRWGNFFNQEAYGSVVSKSLLNHLLVPNFIINGMFIDGSYHLPTFWFESIFCIIGFIIMIIIRRKLNIKIGTLSAFYFIWYGILRFIIESFRTDSLMLGFLKQAQIISIISIIIGIIILLKKNRKLYKE